ncbi:MAG TPA: sugar phosphate isomerase/epimerase family protein [Puia sp.]|nr:sugar phosphate isomerase/epimerase family protein [Puia sp.]
MKKLRFACADFTFPLLAHDKVLSLIAMLDCGGVDIGLFSGRSHLTAESEFGQLRQRARTLSTLLEDRGLVATDVYLQLDTKLSAYAINHPQQARRQYARERFLQLLDYAGELGADHITTLPGMHFPEWTKEETIVRCYEELYWRLEKATAAGLVFSVEVHIGCPFTDPVDMQALLDAVSGLTLTLDYTHFIYNGYPQSAIDPFLRYASHFHARGAREGRLQTSMTDNTIDYKEIIEKLKAAGYEGWIGLEYIWTAWEHCNEADTLSETIRLRDLIKEAYK